jgi:hypothetical protein
MAYMAALRYARAALHACGYRLGRERAHERMIDSLGHTISTVDAETILLLHKIRKKRHVAAYDSVEMISDSEADAAIKTAISLGTKVIEWLKENHPKLLLGKE